MSNMEYKSPLGYNFKLERSLSASNEERRQETPKRDDYISFDNSGKRNFSSDNRRSSGGRNNSPWQKNNQSNWKSPNNRHFRQEEPAPIEQYFHQSMLENPWEELEKN